MITKTFMQIGTKSLRQKKSFRNHAGTGDADYVLNHEISGFYTLALALGSGELAASGEVAAPGELAASGEVAALGEVAAD